jgi:hypothetical protein
VELGTVGEDLGDADMEVARDEGAGSVGAEPQLDSVGKKRKDHVVPRRQRNLL